MIEGEHALYLPTAANGLTRDDLCRWFQNIAIELSALQLSPHEKGLFETYYRSAGLLSTWRRPFFFHHYVRPLELAIRTLFESHQSPRILDLGAGTGTQSLLFALLGAKVVAADMDDTALHVLRKRKVLYERQAGRELDIDIKQGNVFNMNLASGGAFDGVYSLFAFNMMQPTDVLLERLKLSLGSRAVLAIQDGNRKHVFNAVFRRRHVLSNEELTSRLQRLGFSGIRHVGGYAIPPPFWRLFGSRALVSLDRWLASFEMFAVSHLHLARKGG